MKTITSDNWDRSPIRFLARRSLRKATLFSGIVSLLLAGTTLAAPSWSPPVSLSYPAVNAHSPAVAVNDNGMAANNRGVMVAAWVRQEGLLYEVQASMKSYGTWSPPVNLSQTGQNAFEVNVAIDRNGVATAVWTIGESIQTSTFNPALKRGWSKPIAISEPSISAIFPRVVIDGAGNLTAMWVRYDLKGAPRIETADCLIGGSWGAPKVLAAGAPRDLMLVTNERGDAAAIWDTGAFTSNTAVYVATRSSSQRFTGWTAPYLLASPAYRQGGGKVGIDAKGTVIACWRSNTDVRAAEKPVRGNWEVAKVIYSSTSLSAYPTLAVMPSGDAMAAWTTAVWAGGSYNYQIHTSIYHAGGNWGAATDLTTSDEYALELNAGPARGGACLLTWRDVNSSSLKSSTWTVNGWTGFATIASGEDSALAVSGNTALAIWIGGAYQAQVSTTSIFP